MKISEAILSVLTKEGQVGLPHLGLLEKSRTEGYFDRETNTFHPPQDNFRFQQDDYADSLGLIDVLKETYPSEGSAKIALEQYVEDLKDELQSRGEVEIEGVGKLIYLNGQIAFEQSEASNIGFFGLPSVALDEQEITSAEEKTETREEEEVIPVAGSTEEADIIEPKEEIPDVENQEIAPEAAEVEGEKMRSTEGVETSALAAEEEVVEKKTKSKIWLYVLLPILIIGIILAGIYFLRPDIYQGIVDQVNVDKEKAGKVQTPPVLPEPALTADSAIADSIYEADIEANLQKSGLEYEKVKDSADITVQQIDVPKENKIRYEVVIAAWKSQKKAEDHVRKLKAGGIPAHIVEKEGDDWKRVSVATFDNRAEAETELRRVRKELNENALITTIKN